MCQNTDGLSVCGKPIALLAGGAGAASRIQWCRAVDKMIYGVMAYYQLTPSNLRTKLCYDETGSMTLVFAYLCRLIDCDHPEHPQFNTVVHRKLETHMIQLLEALHKQDVIVIYHLHGSSIKDVYWPPATRDWHRPDWAFDLWHIKVPDAIKSALTLVAAGAPVPEVVQAAKRSADAEADADAGRVALPGQWTPLWGAAREQQPQKPNGEYESHRKDNDEDDDDDDVVMSDVSYAGREHDDAYGDHLSHIINRRRHSPAHHHFPAAAEAARAAGNLSGKDEDGMVPDTATANTLTPLPSSTFLSGSEYFSDTQSNASSSTWCTPTADRWSSFDRPSQYNPSGFPPSARQQSLRPSYPGPSPSSVSSCSSYPAIPFFSLHNDTASGLQQQQLYHQLQIQRLMQLQQQQDQMEQQGIVEEGLGRGLPPNLVGLSPATSTLGLKLPLHRRHQQEQHYRHQQEDLLQQQAQLTEELRIQALVRDAQRRQQPHPHPQPHHNQFLQTFQTSRFQTGGPNSLFLPTLPELPKTPYTGHQEQRLEPRMTHPTQLLGPVTAVGVSSPYSQNGASAAGKSASTSNHHHNHNHHHPQSSPAGYGQGNSREARRRRAMREQQQTALNIELALHQQQRQIEMLTAAAAAAGSHLGRGNA